MGKRKVVVHKWQKVKGQPYNEKVADGHGIFHQFGIDYEEFEYFMTEIIAQTGMPVEIYTDGKEVISTGCVHAFGETLDFIVSLNTPISPAGMVTF